jgi:tetratricopeptide (TPR) repeat protein
MVRRLLPLVLLVFLAASAFVLPGSAHIQANNPQDRSERVKRGVSHFDRAFYGLTPHKRDAEASREFDLAIGEFEAELRAKPNSVEAHRYLARIFTVRKQHRQAARHYDEISHIEPGDVDACVLAAVAWAEAGERAEARERLLEAKSRTTDPGVLGKLDEYLAKLDRDHPIPLL